MAPNMLKIYYSFIVLLFVPTVFLQGIEQIVAKFQQNDYKLIFEWAEVASFNKQYMKQLHSNAFKYNRTCTAANLTYEFNVDLDNDLDLIAQAYKFASNEYRLFPLRMQINFCYALSKNLVGSQKAFTCGNFTGCPLRKGTRRHICNWTPDETQFPPFIPSGRYRLDAQGVYKGMEMFLLRYYGSIDRPIAWQ